MSNAIRKHQRAAKRNRFAYQTEERANELRSKRHTAMLQRHARRKVMARKPTGRTMIVAN